MSDQRTRSANSIPTLDPAGERNRSQPEANGPDDTAEPEGQFPDAKNERAYEPPDSNHEGATEEEVGDRRGPGAGYDQEPAQVPDTGGVA